MLTSNLPAESSRSKLKDAKQPPDRNHRLQVTCQDQLIASPMLAKSCELQTRSIRASIPTTSMAVDCHNG
eukprot:5153303-Amphidinium_carterae.1